jgi:hypothetical protein
MWTRRHLLFAAGAAAVAGGAARPAAAADRTADAKNVVALLAKGDFAGASKGFDDTMKKALPPDKLKAVWGQITGQAGAYKSQLGTRSEKFAQSGKAYDIAYVTCQFEKGKLEAKVVYDPAGKVAGLFFVPKK